MRQYSVYVSIKTSFTLQCRIKSSLHYSFWTLPEKMPLRGGRASEEGQSGGSSARVPQAMRPEPPLGKGHRPWTPPRPPPVSMTDAPNRRGPKPADNGRGPGASAAGARVAASKIRHRSGGQRQGQGSSPPGSRAGPPHPPPRPTRHPRTAPPRRRTRPPRRPGPPRAARPPGPLTRPGSSRSRRRGRHRRRRRPLRPRPSHGRRLPQEPHRSSLNWAAGPGTTSFRNRLAPPPVLATPTARCLARSPLSHRPLLSTLSQRGLPRPGGSGQSACALCRPFPPLPLCPGRMRHLPPARREGKNTLGPWILRVKGQRLEFTPQSEAGTWSRGPSSVVQMSGVDEPQPSSPWLVPQSPSRASLPEPARLWPLSCLLNL